jgi:hypothetical protein
MKILKLAFIFLIFSMILGCANSNANPPKHDRHGDVRSLPIRIIVNFDNLPAIGDQRPIQLISELCECLPVFIRQYLGNALIYEITLPQGLTYDKFEMVLLQRGGILGFNAIEQDTLMKNQ